MSERDTSADGEGARRADPRLARLERIRPYRVRREREASIGTDLEALRRGFAERQRTLGDVIEAWNALAPASIQEVSAVAGVSNGTLTIAARGSSASYEISRALRDGLERRLVERLPARVRRVKVKVAGGSTAGD